MKIIFLVILLTMSSVFSNTVEVDGVKKIERVAYYKELFGHIHRNATKYSQSLSTITCGHPVKIYSVKHKNGHVESVFNKDFYLVKVGPYEGFIHRFNLVDSKPNCFQDKYPRFFDHLELSLTDMYFWGKLHDQYEIGKSKVK